MHHGDDPHAVRLIQVNDRVRELTRERSRGGRVKSKEALRLSADILNESVDLTIKANAQIWIYGGMISYRILKLRVGFGMDHLPHRPAILRMRARDSSSG